jgi:hypothetical protein
MTAMAAAAVAFAVIVVAFISVESTPSFKAAAVVVVDFNSWQRWWESRATIVYEHRWDKKQPTGKALYELRVAIATQFEATLASLLRQEQSVDVRWPVVDECRFFKNVSHLKIIPFFSTKQNIQALRTFRSLFAPCKTH